jgi:hypothetical protein
VGSLDESTSIREIDRAVVCYHGYGTEPRTGDGDGDGYFCCQLDYCLVAMTKIAYTNILPYWKSSHAFRPPFAPTGNTAPMVDGMQVCKIGRTTGVTFGRVHGVKLSVSVDSAIGSSKWTVQSLNKQKFADRGDCGACVWNAAGDLVGMIWGSVPVMGDASC